jgi:predicted transcriptional regulator
MKNKLTDTEEQVMKYIWRIEKGYMKDILDEFPEPKPAATTLATLLKRMIDKGYVAFNQHGSNREYYPLVKKAEYFTKHLNGLIKNYFNDSASQFASFFTTEADLSEKDLEELRKIIDKQIEKKKK